MIYNDNIILLAVFSVFSLATATQLFYYLYFYLAPYTHKTTEKTGNKEAVSVIICARNEAENLKNFLPFVLEQDYPDFEVIVVNDCSEDNSYDILGKFLLQYPHLRVSNVNKDAKFTHNKKFAQFIGIKAAKNEILLFTDADCHPESNKWIEKMTSHFDDNICFVLGYGGYIKSKGLLNKYIRYESMTIAIQYLGMAIRGVPYMGVGRNLAYRRSLFFSNKGFGAHNHIVSGDDDLFVNSIATKTNIAVEFSHDAHTRSAPMSQLKGWIKQKKRHLTTAPFYKTSHKILLLIEPLSRVLFYSSFIILLLFSTLWPVLLSVFMVRLITQVSVLIAAGKKLKEKGIITYSLIFDIFSPVINSILFFSNSRSKSAKNKWK